MKIISKSLLWSSAFSLVLPQTAFASLSSAYASLVDTSQNQAFESKPAQFLKLAAVHFIANDGGLKFGGQEFNPGDLCKSRGYLHKGCPAGYIPGEACTEDSSFVKECIDPDTWCRGNGYNVTSCTLPKYLSGKCPHSSTLYKSCETDNARACRDAGYASSCEVGKIGDRACPYDSKYKTCVCNPCAGFAYTSAQASAQGYVPGEVCNSCGTMKYKRSEAPCDGFKTCDCGGATGAKTCWSGTVKKFDTCKECCDTSKYKYDSSNCTGGNQLAGNSCGGKYDKCERKVKAGAILYSDMTTSSELNNVKIPIGVVFDDVNKLAVVKDGGGQNCFFCHEVSSGLAEYEVYNPPLTVFSKQEDALADVSGEKNTMDLVAYTKQKNASAVVGEYFMHKTLVDEERGVFYEWPDSVFFSPSLGQLKTLYDNREAVDAGLKKLRRSFDGLTRAGYSYLAGGLAKVVWSSTYAGDGRAWAYNFGTGDILKGDVERTENSLRVINYDRPKKCTFQYKYDASSCLSGLGGDICDGKYEICQTIKPMPLLYHDKSLSYQYDADKYLIGIVVDENARLAIPIDGTEGMYYKHFEGELSKPKPQLKKIEGLQNCTKENLRFCDVDGFKNTKAILDFGEKIGQSYPLFEYVRARSFVWGMGDLANKCNCWYGAGKWFVPSAAQLLKFYEVYDRVIASAKLIPSTIVNSTGRYSYSVSVESFNPHMSSNQLDAEFYWGVRQNDGINEQLFVDGKWPYPSISGDGTIQYAGVSAMPMLYY